MESETNLSQAAAAFQNARLDPTLLPDYSEAALEPVAPGFLRYVILSTLSFWAIPLLVSAFSGWIPFINFDIGWFTFLPLSIVVLLILFYRLADARYRGWALREHDLIAQSGVWWRTTTTLPIARIQHVESSSGPIERAHNLARLSCYTAGGMTADLVVIALSTDSANRLREHLLEQIRLRDEQDAPIEEHAGEADVPDHVSAASAESASTEQAPSERRAEPASAIQTEIDPATGETTDDEPSSAETKPND